MRVFKPLQLSFLYKSFSVDERYKLAVTGLLGFEFDKKEHVLEPDLWKMLGSALGKDAMLDMCLPKPNGEAIAYGNYYSVNEEKVTAANVRLKIKSIDKELAVIGDRYWRPLLGATKPEPFSFMPIDFSRAFGGLEFKKNPGGKGIEEVDYLGEQAVALPNVEAPSRLITSKADRPLPASFSPIDPTWPQRAEKMGTYDEKWKNERWPHAPEDLDWSFYNAAEDDQILDGFFEGDESFEIENMHPQEATLNGSLPGVRVRCIVEREVDKQLVYEDVKMRAETVWFFPHLKIGVLGFRGTCDIESYDALDVKHLILAYENLNDEPRPLEHYKDAMLKRADEKEGFKYLLSTEDLIPVGGLCGFKQIVEQAIEPELALNKNLQEKAAETKAEMLASVQESLDGQVSDKMTDVEKQAISQAKEKVSAGAGGAKLDEESLALMRKLLGDAVDDAGNVDFKKLDFAKLSEMGDVMREHSAEKEAEVKLAMLGHLNALPDDEENKELKAKLQAALTAIDAPALLPRVDMTDMRAQMRQQHEEISAEITRLKEKGVSDKELAVVDFDIDEIEEKIADTEKKMKEGYVAGAHFMDAGALNHTVSIEEVKEDFLEQVAQKGNLDNKDYAGINVSGMVFSNSRINDCYLEQSNLESCKFSSVDLSNTVMARANLKKSLFENASLVKANLGGCDLSGAHFSQCDVRDLVLAKSKLSNAVFEDCEFDGMGTFLETNMENAKFIRCKFEGCNFVELNMSSSTFEECDLSGVNFVKCEILNGQFNTSNLSASNFVECNLPKASFLQAKCENTRFLGGCDLRGAQFDGAVMNKASVRDADAEGASFRKVQAEMADFAGANLQKTSFDGCKAKRAIFNKSDLFEASFVGSDLVEASFLDARITRASFEKANMFCVEFMNATLGETKFNNANLDGSKLKDWQPS